MNIKFLFTYFLGLLWNLNDKFTLAREWKTRIEKVDGSSNQDYEIYSTWDEFKTAYNRSFSMGYRESRRQKAYEHNLAEINKHNKAFEEGQSTFKMRTTSMCDLETQEYRGRYIKLEESPIDLTHGSDIVASAYGTNDDLPLAVDWREEGFVTPPENQKSCGACYAFSIAASVEGQVFARINKIIKLSTQQMVDCSVSHGNHGCSGGSLRNTLRYLEERGGLMREKDYPYVAAQNKCKFIEQLSIVNVTTWAILPPRQEELLQLAVATIGPIPISINAAPRSFQLYSSGIYDDPECKSNAVNHAMLLIGYTPKYWIIKNWWGKNWGENGYMKIVRGKNMCGLANFPAYAVV
uniref:cathepsin L n=1 Tax=Culicoides sonorensis TaxID=179676 RepID=A0A336KK13_CULSO